MMDTPKQLVLMNYYEGGHSMELRRGSVMRLQEIFVPLVSGMDGFGCAIIVSGQRCAPVLLTFLHKAEGQLLLLLTFFNQLNNFSV